MPVAKKLMNTSQDALPKGYVLNGEYQIERFLGGGGFSVVYLATETASGQKCVIKEYLPGNQAHRVGDSRVEPLSEDCESVFKFGIKRFFDEAAALARINHPHIVRVQNVFRANNTVYMVMTHEHGKDLRWYIKHKSGPLSERFLRTVFPKLLHGLEELHANRLLHLDIKPANIYLRPGGNPLLLDFGAARDAISDRKRRGPQTLTLGYAPIEQHRGGHLGPWSDLYAIGAAMHACLAGVPPPPATERAEKDRYKPVTRRFARRYSPQLLEAIDWCLRVNQLDRPQKVLELREVFDRDASPSDSESSPLDTLLNMNIRLPWLGRR